MTNPWTEKMHDHFHKWHLDDGRIVHWFTGVDGGFPHDHNFPIMVEVMKGSYCESAYDEDGMCLPVWHLAGEKFVIPAKHIHLITELPQGECFTICRYGPKVQEPSFYRWDNGKRLRRRHDWAHDDWREG